MKLYSMLLVVTLMALLSACVAPVQAVPAGAMASEQIVEEEAGHTDNEEIVAELGDVNFPVSCTAQAQTTFDLGLALLYSFEYGSAIDVFNSVIELDPTCAMAYWGVAMSLVEPLWGEPTEQRLSDGWSAIEKAQAIGVKTPREQAYIDAITAFYQDSATLDHRTRSLAYEQAMAQLVQDYGDDDEAKIFYALALLATAQPTDKSYANQRQAVEILEPIYAEQPNHPGAAHYLIHSNDYPALAGHGLDAARRYAGIAPAAPHALHMPAHIFTRLGYWQESIDTNQAGADAARARLPESAGENLSSDPILHATDYMMYAYLQLAQDEAAKAVFDEIYAIDRVTTDEFGAAYALAAIPARYVLERGQWDEAAALTLHPSSFGWELFPQAEATLVFARGLGAARAGDVDAARQELERLQSLHETLVADGPEYWAGQVDIQRREVEAWTALAEFEAALITDPNRFRSLYGAAHAAHLAGEMETARGYYETLTANAGSERAEVQEAEAFLTQ